MKTRSYVNAGRESEIKEGLEYRFGELYEDDGDVMELLESGAIALYEEDETVVVDFEVIEMDEEKPLDSIVKITSI